MAVQTRVGMPMDEFIREFDRAPFVVGDGIILKKLYVALLNDEQKHGVSAAFAHMPYVLTDHAAGVIDARSPDIMLFRTERLVTYYAETPDFGNRPFILAPDLCVEITAANEKYFDVEDKIDHYLADGVKLIWVMNPRSKTVTVYTQGSNQITRLTIDATLSGGDVLPNFTLPVKDIFPE